ncbi:MAG: dynamin family protein, partial [Thiomargarita sp.]|nr:dynamin family protein [Thiomargarita sp.]
MSRLDTRLNKLKEHLKEEHTIFPEIVDSFRLLDKVAYKLGFLSPDESYATRLSWWPMISVLGAYS